jgi:hypothetical protein
MSQVSHAAVVISAPVGSIKLVALCVSISIQSNCSVLCVHACIVPSPVIVVVHVISVKFQVAAQMSVVVAEAISEPLAVLITVQVITHSQVTLNVFTSEPFNISITSSVSAAEPLFQVSAHLVESVTVSGVDELSRTCCLVAVPITQGLFPQTNGLLSTGSDIFEASHFIRILATAVNQEACQPNNQ